MSGQITLKIKQLEFNASKLAIAVFIVPYMFCFNPAMLFIDTTVLQVVQIAITSFVGVFGVAAAMEGYCFAMIKTPIRILIATGALLLIPPALSTDIAGLAIVAVCLFYQAMISKKQKVIA